MSVSAYQPIWAVCAWQTCHASRLAAMTTSAYNILYVSKMPDPKEVDQ